VTLNGVNPTIDIAFSLDLTAFLATNQLNQSFSGDVNDTALVSFTPLDGVTVDSGRGSFQEPWPRRPYQAALPLFASGLGGLGLLGWGRKRKGTATPLSDRAYCRLPTRLFAQAFLLNGTWLRMRSGSSIGFVEPCLPSPAERPS
jgi:hypothetical protein